MTLVGLAARVFWIRDRLSPASASATALTARMGMVLAGIVVTLVGIMGVMTPAYQKTWIFKK
jgi:hypothetical protein